MSETLFEMVDDYQQCYELATDPDTDPQVFQDTIDGLMGMIEVKAAGYANVLKQLEMEQKQAEEVSKMFADKSKVRKNNIKRMKESLLEAMKRLNKAALNAGAFVFKIENNGGKESLIIDDPDAVPENMMKITIEPDHDKIREYLKDNKCKWAHLERGQHIAIR